MSECINVGTYAKNICGGMFVWYFIAFMFGMIFGGTVMACVAIAPENGKYDE